MVFLLLNLINIYMNVLWFNTTYECLNFVRVVLFVQAKPGQSMAKLGGRSLRDYNKCIYNDVMKGTKKFKQQRRTFLKKCITLLTCYTTIRYFLIVLLGQTYWPNSFESKLAQLNFHNTVIFFFIIVCYALNNKLYKKRLTDPVTIILIKA